MKILFICKGEYRFFFPSIAQALRELDGCESIAVTFTAPATRVVERTRAFDSVHDLSSFLKKITEKSDLNDCMETLRAFESAGEANILNMMVQADRIMGHYPRERILRFLAGIIAFWRELIGKVQPDAILGEIACATEWIAWSIAQRHNIPCLLPYPTPAANRFFFIDGPAGSWVSMQDHFKKLKKRRLSPEEEQVAESVVQEYRSKKSKPPFLASVQRSPLIPDVRQLFRRAARIPFRLHSYLESGVFEVGSYHGTPPWKPVWEDSLRILRHVYCESFVLEHSVAASPYVYFPLHVQPEFTTDVRAPFFTNQLAVIESVSKSVPISHCVLVKEHPGMKGERALGFYRRLKSLHNVHLVSPSLDSHKLIEYSDAVITITGSSAWEAILYEKPVIALGPLCYGFYEPVYRCKTTSDLPELIREALERFRPGHELLLKFVLSFLQTAYELQWGDPIRLPQILEPLNVRKIAMAILTETSARSTRCSLELIPN